MADSNLIAKLIINTKVLAAVKNGNPPPPELIQGLAMLIEAGSVSNSQAKRAINEWVAHGR